MNRPESTLRSDEIGPEELAWRTLTGSFKDADFFNAWLALLAADTGAQETLLVLEQSGTGPFAVAAHWPVPTSIEPIMAEALELALAQRRAVAKRGESGGVRAQDCAIACPILAADHLLGVVLVKPQLRPAPDIRRLIRRIQWALPWVTQRVSGRTVDPGDMRAALDLLAAALDHDRAPVAAGAVATALAEQLDCDRVAIGFRRGRSSRVVALSHAGNFAKKAELVTRIADAMDEAIDQDATIIHPSVGRDPLLVDLAHAALADTGRRRWILSVPLHNGNNTVGAVTFERREDRPFAAKDLALVDLATGLLGPVLHEKRLNDRMLATKAMDSAVRMTSAALGPRRLGLKVAVLAGVTALAVLLQTEVDFRVNADAQVEGALRRVIAAPLDGYVTSAAARAGDLVNEGQILATLDDRELSLELRRWETVRAQREREYERALSGAERAMLGIVRAQIDQADAEIALLSERVARTRLAAPFDGVILAGDLDQQVGAPVLRGAVLFELAPFDRYRVILSVDERDLAVVHEEFAGELALASLPGETFPIRIGRITSVARVEDGRNVFRVEAALTEAAPELRPGMRGVAKVLVGRRPILEVWTRNVVTWARLALWRWTP